MNKAVLFHFTEVKELMPREVTFLVLPVQKVRPHLCSSPFAMPYRFALFVVAVNELPVTTLVNADTTSNSRTFLVAQWLRLGFPMQGREGLVQELRSHMPCGQKNRSNIVTNSIKIKKKNFNSKLS